MLLLALTDKFKESPQDPKLRHRITWSCLREGSAIRGELEKFIAGESVSELHALKELAFELKLIPTVERVQEADHSIVHRMVVYRRVTGPYVSCALRLPELQNIFESDAQYQSFLEKFAEVDDMADMAKRFGFLRHPRWQVATAEKFSEKQKGVLAALIMYSMDVESQFQKMQGATKARAKRFRERKNEEDKWKAHFQGKKTFSLQTVQQAAMSDHLQSELQVGRLYSVPASGIAVQSLQSSLQPLHLQTGGSRLAASPQGEVLALTSDVEMVLGNSTGVDGHSSAPVAQDAVYWRLTCAKPSKHKLVRLPVASAARLGSDDFCVTLHRFIRCEGNCFVEAEPAAAQGVGPPVAVLSVFKADMVALREGMLSWSTVKDLAFTMAGYEASPSLMSILKKLVKKNAWPGAGPESQCVVSVHAEEFSCVQSLARCGLVQVQTAEDGHCCVCFTQDGMAKLRHMHRCAAPAKFFKEPAALADIPREELCYCTTWELLTMLQHGGWQLRQAPRAGIVKKKPLPPHTAEALQAGQLRWYLRGISLHQSKPYMLALLQSQHLFETCALIQLHHCQRARYYEKVLTGDFDGGINLASIADDSEAVPRLSFEAPPVADSVAPAARRPAQDTATEQPEREAIADDAQLLLQHFAEQDEEAHASDVSDRSIFLESASVSQYELSPRSDADAAQVQDCPLQAAQENVSAASAPRSSKF